MAAEQIGADAVSDYDFVTASRAVRRVMAEEDGFDPSMEEDTKELIVADYVIFLLALDTYMRYLSERFGTPDINDKVLRSGLALLKVAERRHLDAIKSFLASNVKNPTSIKMLEAAVRPPPSAKGAARRANLIRTVLSRGGTVTTKAVFDSSAKALREVREAIEASLLEDEDAALTKFSAITLRNKRLEAWIDTASDAAQPGSVVLNDVQVATRSTSEDVSEVLKARVEQEGQDASLESADQGDKQSAALLKIEAEATQAARRVQTKIDFGEPERPMVRSEVIGLAKAVATSVITDPELPTNIPPSLQGLDPEQLAAAMTDGRVLVAAGAGAGKSTTLVGRIAYLSKDKGVNPARIMTCSFNTRAAEELKEKIAKKLGPNGVRVGTMHSLFYKFITGDQNTTGYGNPAEQAMLKPPRLIAPPKKGANTINPSTISNTIRKIWTECKPEELAARTGLPVDWFEAPPKAASVKQIVGKWRGNDVSLEAAKATVRSKAEGLACLWYEFYLGLKGDIPGWKPPCQPYAYTKFMQDHRKGGERLGDLDDMVKVFRDILQRDVKARKAVQGMFDHFLVDECQDLNLIQHQVFEMLSEHVTDGSDGKSIWMVGDDKQSIYQFRGARPELFTSLNGKDNWKTRMIRTNYRCEAEIVEAANRLIAYNVDQIPMEARANPKKGRGNASIVVDAPPTYTSAAIATIGRVRKDIDTEGAEPEEYAVLARTNAELHNFETACIINEIPYIRKGGKGFLEAPESKAVLGYIDLATGADYAQLRESLIACLMKPDRSIFLGPDDVEKAVKEALDDVSRIERIDAKNINPLNLLDNRYVGILAERLKQPYRLKIINSAINRGKNQSTAEWMYKQRVGELESNLRGLSSNVRALRYFIEEEEHSTNELLDYVLDNMPSETFGFEGGRSVTTQTTLREQISSDILAFAPDDAEEVPDDEEVKIEINEEGQVVKKDETAKPVADQTKGLGAVEFLFALAEPNANDQTNNTDPTTAKGYVRKLQRYATLADTLRINPEKYAKEQAQIADPGKRREKPPAIVLSTVHSVKGSEWKNVTVVMAPGKFPMERKPKPDEPPMSEEEMEAQLKAERNLAYVALTRAALNLEVVCPQEKVRSLGGPVLSSFVHEADLKLGQNVPKGEAVEEVKTAEEYDSETMDRLTQKASQLAILDADLVTYDYEGN